MLSQILHLHCLNLSTIISAPVCSKCGCDHLPLPQSWTTPPIAESAIDQILTLRYRLSTGQFLHSLLPNGPLPPIIRYFYMEIMTNLHIIHPYSPLSLPSTGYPPLAPALSPLRYNISITAPLLYCSQGSQLHPPPTTEQRPSRPVGSREVHRKFPLPVSVAAI